MRLEGIFDFLDEAVLDVDDEDEEELARAFLGEGGREEVGDKGGESRE